MDADTEALIDERDKLKSMIRDLTAKLSGDVKLYRSTKIADPEPLDNSKEPKFEHWLSRMRNKLKSNADHFPSEALRMVYVEGRVKDEATRYIFPRTQDDHPEAYRTAEEMFKHLADVYKDSDKL
jgi:hypothetical protein